MQGQYERELAELKAMFEQEKKRMREDHERSLKEAAE